MSLHTDIDRGRWKNLDPLLDPDNGVLSKVSGGKLTLRRAFEQDGITFISSDIPRAL